MTVVGQHAVIAKAVTPPQDGYGFDAVAKTNATWLRVLIDWHLVEPMPGAYNWGYVDTADKDNEQDNFGALLTSDWQAKLAASVLAR